METIAIVDDKLEMRETVSTLIGAELEELGVDWTVIHVSPFADMEEYLPWIQENNVCVLVLDENLSDDHPADQDAVAYAGHNVAALLRTQKPELPQFIITSIVDSNDLETSSGDLEAVIRRGDFSNTSSTYVQRMVRAGKSFVSRYESELANLTRIAEAVVRNTATAEDIQQADAIRTKMQLAYDIGKLQSAQDWLVKTEAATASLEDAINKMLPGRVKDDK